MRTRSLWFVALLLCLVGIGLAGCNKGESKPRHRERSAARDVDCKEPERPRAYFYPAANRNEYGPDDPKKDGCALIVPDHIFCCPEIARPTDE
jgi:hypothetical protein